MDRAHCRASQQDWLERNLDRYERGQLVLYRQLRNWQPLSKPSAPSILPSRCAECYEHIYRIILVLIHFTGGPGDIIFDYPEGFNLTNATEAAVATSLSLSQSSANAAATPPSTATTPYFIPPAITPGVRNVNQPPYVPKAWNSFSRLSRQSVTAVCWRYQVCTNH